MPVSGFDHVAIPTVDGQRFLEFYKRLGFSILHEERWLRGEIPFFSVIVGRDNLINVHTPGLVTDLRGREARPGSGDFCFVWDGSIEEVLQLLEEAGVPPVEGPVARAGGRAGGQTPSQSVYIRDPDGNLLEFMVY